MSGQEPLPDRKFLGGRKGLLPAHSNSGRQTRPLQNYNLFLCAVRNPFLTGCFWRQERIPATAFKTLISVDDAALAGDGLMNCRITLIVQ